MIAFIFNHGLTLENVGEPLIPRDYVLVRPLKVGFNGLENAVYNGQIWARPGIVLGGMGIAKVIEGGIDSEWESMAGKTVVISPYSKAYGGLGIEINGVAAERGAVPKDAIFPYFPDLGDLNVLLPFASIAVKAAQLAEGKRVLVIGYGVLGRLVSMALHNKAEVGVYTEGGRVDYGNAVTRIDPSQWDVVFVSTISSWPRVLLSDKKIMMPRLMASWPIIGRERITFVEPEFVEPVVELLRSHEGKLKDVILHSDSFVSAIPVPKGKIVLVNPEKALKTTSP